MNELLLEKYAYKKKKPVLLPYIDNIKLLLEHDATQKSILEYLKNEEGIIVSQPYLSKFIKQYIYNDQQTASINKPAAKQLLQNTPKSKLPKEELSKDNEQIQNTTSSKKEELDDDTLASMEEYMKNMSHIFEAKKRRQ